MAELFRHVDEDSDVFEFHQSRSEGMYYVSVLPGGELERVRVVDLAEADARRLLDALLKHFTVVHEVVEHGVGRELIDSTECICGFWGDDAEWHQHFTELGLTPPCAGVNGCETCFPEDGDDG